MTVCKCYNTKPHQWTYSPYTNCPVHPKCPYVHSRKIDKNWLFSPCIELGGLLKSNGVIGFRVRCTGCGRESSEIGTKATVNLIHKGYQYCWTRKVYGWTDLHHCQVRGCGSTAVEWHHFAPRNVFPDADDWPYLPLCRKHHRHWHDSMNGYHTNGKASFVPPEFDPSDFAEIPDKLNPR